MKSARGYTLNHRKVTAAFDCFRAGLSQKATARRTGLAYATVQRYRALFEAEGGKFIRCGCISCGRARLSYQGPEWIGKRIAPPLGSDNRP